MDRKQRHIDQIFEESLKDFELMPPDAVWTSIEAELDRKRRYPFIVFWSSLAAGIALLIGVGIYWLDDGHQVQVKNVSQINQPSSNHKKVLALKTKMLAPKLKVVKIEKPNGIASVSGVKVATQPVYNGQSIKTHVQRGENITAEPSSSVADSQVEVKPALVAEVFQSPEINWGAINDIDNKAVVDSVKKTVPETKVAALQPLIVPELTGSNTKPEAPAKPGVKGNRWSVVCQVAPLYSFRVINSISSSVSGKSDFNRNEKGLVAYSSGVKVDYRANLRFSIQVGVYYAVMGQIVANSSSNDMMAFSYNLSDSYQTSQINTSSSLGTIATNEQVSKNVIYSTANTLTVASSSNTNSSSSQLVQQLKYVEVPLLVRYRIVDKRFGVHVLGGVGANILVNNEVLLDQGGATTNIGKTQNLRMVNYSGTFGIGFNYQLSYQLGLSVEPTCKYYLTPVSNNNNLNVHPYAFGLFTGLIYKF